MFLAGRDTCCSKSSALLRFAKTKLKRRGFPTLKSVYCKAILGFAKKHVCTVVDSFAV